MTVDDQIVVGAVFVLADAGLQQRRVFHRRKAEGDVIASELDAILTHLAFAGSRIEVGSSRIVGELESAAVRGGDAVDKAFMMIAPDWQLCFREAIVSRRRTEEKYF